MTVRMIRVPARFYVDHMERALPTPAEVRGTARHVWIAADDPHVSALLSDARFYAEPFGPDACPPGIIASARATIRAIESATTCGAA
jgi:hypothetical protein